MAPGEGQQTEVIPDYWQLPGGLVDKEAAFRQTQAIMRKKALLVALVALLTVAAISREEPGAIQQDSIEGCWDEVGGGPGYIAGYTWNFEKGMLAIRWQGPDIIYQFKVDYSRCPATFEMVGTFASFHGVFSVEGESMKLCFCAKGATPPTEFTQKTGEYLRILKRKHR